MNTEQERTKEVSAWAPFSNWGFTLLWTATLISNVGTWMHDVGAGWLMANLNPSPATVSLVQAATTLPIFLFALFAGALADRVNKKTLLLTVNVILTMVIASLAVLVQMERVTPPILILYTLLIGTGAAFMAPAWQAIVPSLIPKPQMKAAVALNSLSINISRAIGPALAGILITTVSLAAPFAANAISHVAIVVALLIWKQPTLAGSKLPPEPLLGSMLTGLRHVNHNKPLRDTMIRALGFYFFASAYWALLPLIARSADGGGAEVYGVLLGLIGTGAVLGAVTLPKIRRKIDSNHLVAYGTTGTAITLMLFATSQSASVLYFNALLAGSSWITVLTSLNVSAQMALPNWVRARGLAVYMMFFFGSMSAGAASWGQVANLTSIQIALLIAATGLIVLIPITWHAKLGAAENLDLSPSSYWPEPIVNIDLSDAPDRGPVMISIDYQIDVQQTNEFLAAIHQLSQERFRDGAHDWGVYEDSENPGFWTEWFLLPSWQEHLRQHERVTMHDKDVQEAVRRFHIGTEPPKVRHLLAPPARNQT